MMFAISYLVYSVNYFVCLLVSVVVVVAVVVVVVVVVVVQNKRRHADEAWYWLKLGPVTLHNI